MKVSSSSGFYGNYKTHHLLLRVIPWQITQAISPSDTDFDQNFKNDPYQLENNEKKSKIEKKNLTLLGL